jgi:hypothetical protein
MRRLVAGVFVVVAACAPRWIQPEFREEATDLAIAQAVADYSCPREHVSVRCDASSTTRVVDGRMVVYDEDGVIGTYVDEAPTWEVELAVCGHLRRYRYQEPELFRGVENYWSAARPAVGMKEVRRSCGGAYCLGAEPACTNCGRDAWWPVDTMPDSSFCASSFDDGSIAAEVVDNSVEVVLVVEEPRDQPRSCGSSPLFVVVDGTYYSLCGDGVAHLRPGVHRIPTGITLGVNMQSGRKHVIEAIDARADGCRRSPPTHALLRRTALSWEDLAVSSRGPEVDLPP